MNTTLIAALIALIVGFTAGTALPDNTTDPQSLTTPTETVIAEDFVSLRPAITNSAAEPLSAEEIEDLVYTREEEKLARDVYQTLYEIWGQSIFSNIAQSEQTHTEAIRDLLEKYDVADPVTDDTIGVFTNQELQDLYDSLTATGETSLVDALTVGATIEDLDIYDLQQAIERTDNADIKLVYENLMRGSRNHLRAFNRQLTMNDAEYTPQYISPSEFTNIISSDTERGQSNQAKSGHGGRGWGQGRGNKP